MSPKHAFGIIACCLAVQFGPAIMLGAERAPAGTVATRIPEHTTPRAVELEALESEVQLPEGVSVFLETSLKPRDRLKLAIFSEIDKFNGIGIELKQGNHIIKAYHSLGFIATRGDLFITDIQFSEPVCTDPLVWHSFVRTLAADHPLRWEPGLPNIKISRFSVWTKNPLPQEDRVLLKRWLEKKRKERKGLPTDLYGEFFRMSESELELLRREK